MQQIFFSLDQVDKPASAQSIQTVRNQLRNRGIKALIVIGSYKGVVERSFCVNIQSQIDADYVKMLCTMFSQESFLVVNNNQQASLHYVSTNVVEPIGRFQAVDKSVATKLEAWTYVPQTDTYFAVKGA